MKTHWELDLADLYERIDVVITTDDEGRITSIKPERDLINYITDETLVDLATDLAKRRQADWDDMRLDAYMEAQRD